MTIDHAWMEYSALGYSGTNSGGAARHRELAVRQQQGRARHQHPDRRRPAGAAERGLPRRRHQPDHPDHSCWVFMHNNVHDNNNPNVPQAGEASNGPTGTGMTISGGANDTVMDNTFSNNGAWGILFVPFPDSGTPSLGQSCSATGGQELAGLGCVYDPAGNALLHNHFSHNGYFGNPSNSDFGQITMLTGRAQNCYAGNTAPDGSSPGRPRADPAHVRAAHHRHHRRRRPRGQVLCDTGFGTLPGRGELPAAHQGGDAPAARRVCRRMPNPCHGVPANPWCSDGKPA